MPLPPPPLPRLLRFGEGTPFWRLRQEVLTPPSSHTSSIHDIAWTLATLDHSTNNLHLREENELISMTPTLPIRIQREKWKHNYANDLDFLDARGVILSGPVFGRTVK
jgi:hypothetical protein